MRRSIDRIITSHVGTLPRPDALEAICSRNELPSDDDAFVAVVPPAIADVVRRQMELGIAIVNDSEIGYEGASRITRKHVCRASRTVRPGRRERRGISPDATRSSSPASSASRAVPPAARLSGRMRPLNQPMFCTGPLTYIGHRDAQFDIDNLLRATRGLDVEPFLSAVAPGTVEHWLWNEHYATDADLLFAIADAMHEEYKLITDAGIVLQVDDPDLPDGWQMYPG